MSYISTIEIFVHLDHRHKILMPSELLNAIPEQLWDYTSFTVENLPHSEKNFLIIQIEKKTLMKQRQRTHNSPSCPQQTIKTVHPFLAGTFPKERFTITIISDSFWFSEMLLFLFRVNNSKIIEFKFNIALFGMFIWENRCNLWKWACRYQWYIL